MRGVLWRRLRLGMGLVGVVLAVLIPVAVPVGAAWAAPGGPALPGQAPITQAATPPTADSQPHQQSQAQSQAPDAAAQADQQQTDQQQVDQQQAAQQQAAQQAALDAQQQAAQAAAQTQAQARAAKLAAQQAAAAQRARVVWARRGRPSKLVIVRTRSIDSVSGGALVQRVPRTGGSVSPAGLDAAIPSSWMTIDGTTARLNAAVVLTPGTVLDIEGVKTLQLVGGADAADAADLFTGGGRIQIRGVTVTSVDPGSGQPVGADAAGRPSIVVAASGRLDATDATISDLGTQPVGDTHGMPAVVFGRGSAGSLIGTSLLRNSTGLMLAGSQGVRLQDVTAADSADNGIVLRGDRATALSGIKAEHNGNDGVLVTGPVSARAVTGISTTGNHAYGVSVSGQNGVQIAELNLTGDQAGGLELERDSNTTVHHSTTADEPNGVFLHVNSTNVALDTVTITGGRTGILAEKTTKGLHVTGSRIDTAHVAGMQIGGHDTVLDGLTVTGSRTAIRVERGADGVTAEGVSLVGGTDGLVTSGGTAGVVVKDVSAAGVGNAAIRSLSPGLQITGGQIRGGTTGIDLQAATTVTGIQIGLTATGIRARATEPIALDNVKVDAVSVGVEAQPGSVVTLRNSAVHALQAVRGTAALLGTNDLSLPPLNLLGAIGLPLIGLALLLEGLHLLRQRRLGRPARALPPTVAVGTG